MKNLEKVFILLTLSLLKYELVHSSNVTSLPESLSTQNTFDLQSLLNPPNFTELASLYGHPAETHHVTTEDGYILTLFRLPGDRPALPILLFHGTLDSADTWIIRGNTSLSITLANKGYDVWLGNVRGNRYSRGHKNLDPKVNATYWNFTFNEHGLYDLAASIDYILNNTRAEKLNMFGHLQGSTIMWVLLSMRTEYNNKINVATALAPVCFMTYIKPPISLLVRLFPALYPLLQDMGITKVFGDDSIEALAFRVISVIPVLGYLVDAYRILFPTFGLDSSELEPSFLPTVAQHVPTWTSTKNLAHFAQLTVNGEFARFDYGAAGNLVAYNSLKPPVYELANIKTKVVLLAALNDNLSDIADVNELQRQLPNVIQYVINPRLTMNHMDYVWGRTASDYLYGYILDVLQKYSN